MGLRPTQGDEKRFLSGNRSPWERRPSLCHPERTRISCHAAPDTVACAPFSKERRMKFADATKFHRKSGEAEGSAVLLPPRQALPQQPLSPLSSRAYPDFLPRRAGHCRFCAFQ